MSEPAKVYLTQVPYQIPLCLFPKQLQSSKRASDRGYFHRPSSTRQLPKSRSQIPPSARPAMAIVLLAIGTKPFVRVTLRALIIVAGVAGQVLPVQQL